MNGICSVFTICVPKHLGYTTPHNVSYSMKSKIRTEMANNKNNETRKTNLSGSKFTTKMLNVIKCDCNRSPIMAYFACSEITDVASLLQCNVKYDFVTLELL